MVGSTLVSSVIRASTILKDVDMAMSRRWKWRNLPAARRSTFSGTDFILGKKQGCLHGLWVASRTGLRGSDQSCKKSGLLPSSRAGVACLVQSRVGIWWTDERTSGCNYEGMYECTSGRASVRTSDEWTYEWMRGRTSERASVQERVHVHSCKDSLVQQIMYFLNTRLFFNHICLIVYE